MCITSELFSTAQQGNKDIHDFTAADMRHDGQHSLSGGLGKRKRGSDALPVPSISKIQPTQVQPPFSPDAIPTFYTSHLPSPPLAFDVDPYASDLGSYTDYSHTTPDYFAGYEPPTKARRKIIPRVFKVPSSTFLNPPSSKHDDEPVSPKTTPASLPPKPASDGQPDLRPCGVCHKAPHKRTELENYGDCNRCKGRACYICIRQCLSGGCDRKICSGCCVERGEEGEIWCLDCLEREPADCSQMRMNQ